MEDKAKQFREKLKDVMGGIYDLFELQREYESSSDSERGGKEYFEKDEKCCFEVSLQHERPHEFLQSFLDIIRVNYEPWVMGSLLLNSNMDFLYDEIPEKDFQLGYASIVSKNDEKFNSFWNQSVSSHLEKCGSDFNEAVAVYAVATTGKERYGPKFLDEVATTLDSYFSVDEAIELLSPSMNTCKSRPRKKTYSGYCLDPAMGSRVRLSLWFFVNNEKRTVQ